MLSSLLCPLHAATELFNHLMRNHCQRDQRQRRDDDQIIKVADHWDKTRNKIKGQQGIPDS